MVNILAYMQCAMNFGTHPCIKIGVPKCMINFEMHRELLPNLRLQHCLSL